MPPHRPPRTQDDFLTKEVLERLAPLFVDVDGDGDGDLSREEFTREVRALVPAEVTTAQIETLFDHMMKISPPRNLAAHKIRPPVRYTS